MTHDPLCPHPKCDYGSFNDNACHGFFECPHRCQCDLIAKVRSDTLDKAIAAIQPIWERGKVLDDAVFADGWLTCFESCESALETMRDKP